ncbi:MAG: tRNA 2-thiocytidine(32) synthetase TtcA [Myxococcota bacterium]|nr:tRNA 2-thiocytidine(32) synthetase TtcA [Myxococcota bacterium]
MGIENKLRRQVARANEEFQLIEPGDRVMVAVSGGKDSYAMLHLLSAMQKRVPFDFSLVAVNLDQGHPGFPGHVLETHFQENGFEYRMLAQDTYSIVLDKLAPGSTMCSLCSRLRRGILYQAAVDLGATKIALGHHRDDVAETVLLNLFYSGQLKGMPPKLFSDDGKNVVIRPLIYCAEEDVAAYAQDMDFPIIPCDLCGTQENLKRQEMKALLARLSADNPKVKGNMMAALSNVRPTHLLDPNLIRADELGKPEVRQRVEDVLGESAGFRPETDHHPLPAPPR